MRTNWTYCGIVEAYESIKNGSDSNFEIETPKGIIYVQLYTDYYGLITYREQDIYEFIGRDIKSARRRIKNIIRSVFKYD